MKRKLACGIAFCLALVLAGCGKGSEEQQAANYYQNELGMDKEDAEDLAHELYGNDDEDSDIYEEIPKNTVVEPLPELVNSEWYDCKVQFYDMIFDNFIYMTEEDIRKIVEESAYDIELQEDFDTNGDVRLRSLLLDNRNLYLKGTNRDSNSNAVKYGVLNEGYYYWLSSDGPDLPFYYNKESIEFKDFKTRDDVLAYLNENGFVEVEKEQSPYIEWRQQEKILPDETSVEFADISHYYCKGTQSITFFRIHKLGETDQEIEFNRKHYSGAHLNLVNCVTFVFDTNGAIEYAYDSSNIPSMNVIASYMQSATDPSKDRLGWYNPGYYQYLMDSFIKEVEIMGERID